MSHRPSRVLFASCNSQHYEGVLWDAMAARNASAFVWVGDAVYGDDFYPHSNVVREATPTILNELYQDLLQDPGYKRFTGKSIYVLGTFDDHDYGVNNGDKEYKFRTESASQFIQFLQASSNSHAKVDLSIMKRRAEAGLGVYGVKVLDFRRSVGEELLSDKIAGIEPQVLDVELEDRASLSDRSVAIFFLDCRSQKSPWKRTFPMRFQPDYEGDFLGSNQWEWFQASLARSTASVNIIVQGLQVHADRYFDGSLVESWSRFPLAQQRLYQTILNSNASAPILISGDVHMAEILAKHCQRFRPDNNVQATPNRMLLEVTTSGM
jgi:alkaline phosphatase D